MRSSSLLLTISCHFTYNSNWGRFHQLVNIKIWWCKIVQNDLCSISNASTPILTNNTQKVMLDEDSLFSMNDPLLKPIEYECLMSSLANTHVSSTHTLIVVLCAISSWVCIHIGSWNVNVFFLGWEWEIRFLNLMM